MVPRKSSVTVSPSRSEKSMSRGVKTRQGISWPSGAVTAMSSTRQRGSGRSMTEAAPSAARTALYDDLMSGVRRVATL